MAASVDALSLCERLSRQRLAACFRKERGGHNTKKIDRAHDQRRLAVVPEVSNERSRQQRPQKRDESGSVEAKAPRCSSNVSWIGLRKPGGAPAVLAKAEERVDCADDKKQNDIVPPEEEHRSQYPCEHKPCDRDRSSAPCISAESKCDIPGDRAKVIKHSGKARPLCGRHAILHCYRSNERGNPARDAPPGQSGRCGHQKS